MVQDGFEPPPRQEYSVVDPCCTVELEEGVVEVRMKDAGYEAFLFASLGLQR